MLTEKRHEIILNALKENGIVKLIELVNLTNSSESTIRRDLSYLESINALKRIHGGAKLLNFISEELTHKEKSTKNIQEKRAIAKFAASLIQDGECIYLDAGTTTYEIIDFIKDKEVVVVTNGLKHIDYLVDNEVKCYIIGGKVKMTTKAIIGSDALKCLSKYRFDKCFIGANGVHHKFGFTTPDNEEASLKEMAIKLSKKAYILCDYSKFSEVSFVKFADINNAQIITSNTQDDIKIYKEQTNVKVVEYK